MTLNEQHKSPRHSSGVHDGVAEKRLHLALCLLVLFAGAAARLYDLGGESIDLEEFACLSGISAPNYPTFFQQQRELYPYGAPLAPSLIYFWTRLAGDSIARVRLLFALTGILVMLLGYLVARLLFAIPDTSPATQQGCQQMPTPHPRRNAPGVLASRRAGLIALLCIALSPVHVFHSQEARMYALVSLFALLGMATFLLALETERRRWWWLHWAANIGLVASHYFAVFLLPVYGLALLAREERLSRRAVWWGLGHCLIVAALFTWVRAIPPQADELYSYYATPTTYTILVHIFAGDSTTLSATAFFPSEASWFFVTETARQWIRGSHSLFDVLLVFLSLAAIVGGLFFCLRDFFSSRREAALRWLLLLCWALLPVLLITALSFFWRPVYGSRYVMYSMFAFYVLIGGLISRMPQKSCYVALVALVALTYSYQLSIALPPQTRSAWRQAYEQMRDESGNNAMLLLEDPFWLPVLAMNIDSPPPAPVIAAFGRETLYDATALLIDTARAFSIPDAPDIWVLLVLTTDFDEAPFITALENNRLQFERFYYPGERNLALYRIAGDSGKTPPSTHKTDIDLFAPLISLMAQDKNAAIINAIENDIRYLPDSEGGFWLRLGVETAKRRQTTFAAAAFCRATAVSLSAAMRLSAMAAHWDIALEPTSLAEIALQSADTDSCDRLRTFMQAAFYVNNTAFIEALGYTQLDLGTHCDVKYIYLGIAAHQQGEHEKAASWFRQYPAIEKSVPPEVVEAYGISLTETGDYEQAVRVLQQGIESFPEYHWLYMRLGIAEAALGNHEAAATALRVSHGRAPDNTYIIYLLIESLVALEQYEEASSLAGNPVVAASTESWVLLARWRAYTGAGKDTEGAQVFSKIQDITPELQLFYQHLYITPHPDKVREMLAEIEARTGVVFPEVYMLLDRLARQR